MTLKHLLFTVTFLVLILISCNSRHPSADDQKLPQQAQRVKSPAVDSLMHALSLLQSDPMLRNGTIGYMIVDVSGKEPVVLADYNAKELMVPASTLKIFVTGAALDIIGRRVIPEVTITNLMSINWRSSKLLRMIGKEVYKTATTQAGVRAIMDFWTSRGVDTTGMNFYDGNGLSHSNAISPKQLVDALYAMRTSPYFEVFYESLPIAGLTGTLHRAMKNSAAVGRIRAKTGTISSVKSFAGYVHTVSDRKLVFSLIVNDYNGRVKEIKKKMEGVMIRMAEI
jgi:D-alanyl-D-alanine carboxypeptidase